MDLFDGLFVTQACPNCNYGMDVELLSVRLEATTLRYPQKVCKQSGGVPSV